MKRVNERVKDYRNKMNLSQEYVAEVLGVSRSAVTQLESGQRKISSDEVVKLCELFGVTSDALLYGDRVSEPGIVFMRSFEKLDEADQAEIMNLIKFKEEMKAQRKK